MVIRFLIANAFAVGGTVRTTFVLAGRLAEHHDVEVVSIYRLVEEPALALDPRVRLRTLTDLRPAALRDPRRRWPAQRPSRVIHPQDSRYDRFNLLSDLELRRFLWSTRDGVLIATRPGLNLAVARHARRGVVTVGQDHLNLEGYPAGLVRALGEQLAGLDAFTALTEQTAAKYRALIGPHARTRVEAIPNAAPPPSADPAALEAPVVAAAGTLNHRKGFDRLLRAWALVAADRPGWRLDIHGTGEGEARLRRQIERLGVSSSVRLRGHSPRLVQELHGASVFALTSRREGFPMVVLEAMSAGVPVVAYDCPTGPRDIITDGVDGRVVANGRTRLLADALAELMDDGERRRALGAAALETAGRYGIDAIAGRWEALLADLAAGR